MASGDTKTNQYLDIAANGTRADFPASCCESRSQTLIREVGERIMDLEDEVERLENNPDVADIVATYADLQSYDTSQLTDKDVIRVLQDETHSGASTYYRWSISTQSFTYIGEVGDYYTKSQTDTLLDAKQDELTAGDNITIEDESGALVINATDTTYSNFTGTDGTAAGAAGLVPAPATTDADKFLKSDGTWGTVQAGPTVVQTTGSSTTDVMSQDATTKMVFKDGDTKAVCIGDGATTVTTANRQGIAIGRGADSSGDRNNIAIGSAEAKARNSIAIGSGAMATYDYSVAIGSSAKALDATSLAMGEQAYCSATYAVAAAPHARATVMGQFDISTGFDSLGYNNTQYRLLTGVYDPQSAHDAATKGYVDGLVGNIESALNAINNGTGA